MSIIREKNSKTSQPRKLLGVKISRQIISELKAYARYVGHPINYCAERLLEYALSCDLEFQTLRSRSRTRSSVSEKAWQTFLAMGQNAAPGKSSDASTRHDRYVYSSSGTK